MADGSYAKPWFVTVLNPFVTPLAMTRRPFGPPETEPQRSIGMSAIGLHEFEPGSYAKPLLNVVPPLTPPAQYTVPLIPAQPSHESVFGYGATVSQPLVPGS